MIRRSDLTVSLLLSFTSLLAIVPALAAHPASLWIAPLSGGSSIEDAWAAGASVLDRFPERILVSDEGSAVALARAGFRVDGPIRLPAGGEIFLVRSKGEVAVAEGLARAIGPERDPVAILWSDGRCAIVWTEGLLPETDVFVSGKRLREEPIRMPIARPGQAAGKALATVFPPVIDQIVDQVDSASYMQWIGNLAGSNEIEVAGNPFTIATRYTRSAECDTVERYVYERFQAMGIDSVEYDPYTIAGTPARNVIATIPGTTHPERIYIIGAHVDATSQNPYVSAPGANDNASGTASVLLAAEILRNYSFESTIKFIAFTGEEQGLYGSYHYAAEAAANGDSILGVVICDMVAWYQSAYRLIIEGVNPSDWLMQIMKDACVEYTGLATRLDYYSWGSDHVPFQDEGFSAFLAIEKEYDLYPCYHKVCDTTEMNNAAFGVDVTRACIATLAYLAGTDVPTGVASEGAAGAPARLVLYRPEPNPFNPSTSIRFYLPASSPTLLAIHDTSGRLVRTVARGVLGPGMHEFVWDGTTDAGGPASSGIYFSRLATHEGSETRKLVLLR
jgi:hypothetical protein